MHLRISVESLRRPDTLWIIFGDSQLEAALTRWNDDIAKVTINAKGMYSALGG